MNYSNKTRDELKAICKERKIKGISGKKKQALIDLIKQNESEPKLPSTNKTEHTSKMKCSICKQDGHNKRSCKTMTTPVLTPKNEAETDIKATAPVKVEMESTSEDILSANYWKNTKTFKLIKDKETQIKYYKKMKSCEEVLQLVDLESKPFGTESEKIIQEIFKLGSRTSPQNDATRNGKKIEIKSARYWGGKDDCVWQHLEPDHDYEYVLFTLLDFQCWKVWGIKKFLLMGEMRDKKIVTFQGKQGWWVKKSAIVSYLTPIKTIVELDSFIQS